MRERITFTEYLQSLKDLGGTLDEALFRELLQQLRGALVLELKRRALWHLSPRCLGIVGPSSWLEPEAIEELQSE